MTITIDLLRNDVWSAADIKRRVQAMIDSELFTPEQAQAAGEQAAADMAKLQAALDYEAAQRRLLRGPVTEPLTVIISDEEGGTLEVPNPDIEQDAAERDAAQALIDAASDETLELVAMRLPPAETVEGGVEGEGV